MAPRSYEFAPDHRGGAGPPMVCLHGFADTWRTWELVLPALQRRHDVLALTLPGHAGGPALPPAPSTTLILDAVEAAMDQAGFATAHLVGNSLGGHLALALAARGRARSVVALAPAGGWALDDPERGRLFERQAAMHEQGAALAASADAIVATPAGRGRVCALIAVRSAHIPAELLAHMIAGIARCDAAPLLAYAARASWDLDAQAISCPVRIIWGTEDRLLPWPQAAARERERLGPGAEWVVLDNVGHCPQLDVPLETAQLILGVTAH